MPWAIQVDLPLEQFQAYGHAHAETHPIQWRGDCRALPFKDESLDFVYSSHLIEDFADWDQVLLEFTRVLKRGGFLVIMVPDRERFREAVANGQGDNLSHKYEFAVGELTTWARKYGHTHPIFDKLTLLRGPRDYNILFVAQKI